MMMISLSDLIINSYQKEKKDSTGKGNNSYQFSNGRCILKGVRLSKS